MRKVGKDVLYLLIIIGVSFLLALPLIFLITDELKWRVGGVIIFVFGIGYMTLLIALPFSLKKNDQENKIDNDDFEMYVMKNNYYHSGGKYRNHKLAVMDYGKHTGYDSKGVYSYTYKIIENIFIAILLIAPFLEISYILHYLSNKRINVIFPIIIMYSLVIILEAILFIRYKKRLKKESVDEKQEDSLDELLKEVLVDVLRKEELTLIDGRIYNDNLYLESVIQNGRVFFEIKTDSLKAYYLTKDMIEERNKLIAHYTLNIRALNNNIDSILSEAKEYSDKIDKYNGDEIASIMKKIIDQNKNERELSNKRYR